ncbi:MAG TPA: hypothetical protein VHO90_17665 [Bacteroidales bacterium]|nr:hypothetical protein [Bacteroidales bacterium]
MENYNELERTFKVSKEKADRLAFLSFLGSAIYLHYAHGGSFIKGTLFFVIGMLAASLLGGLAVYAVKKILVKIAVIFMKLGGAEHFSTTNIVSMRISAFLIDVAAILAMYEITKKIYCVVY